MADLLQIELQKIIEALSGGSGVAPPPGTEDKLKWYLDLIVVLLNEGCPGVAVVPDDYFFSDADARDAYFVANPDKLKDGVLCCTESPGSFMEMERNRMEGFKYVGKGAERG
jgi:hypothetical protein